MLTALFTCFTFFSLKILNFSRFAKSRLSVYENEAIHFLRIKTNNMVALVAYASMLLDSMSHVSYLFGNFIPLCRNSFNLKLETILAKSKWNFTYFRAFFLPFSPLPLSTMLKAILLNFRLEFNTVKGREGE